jgi:hypothetical protein
MAPIVREEWGTMSASVHQMKDFCSLIQRISETPQLEELFVALATRVFNAIQEPPGSLELERLIQALSSCIALQQVTLIHYHLTTGCNCRGGNKFLMGVLRRLPKTIRRIHCGTQRLKTSGEELLSVELTR